MRSRRLLTRSPTRCGSAPPSPPTPTSSSGTTPTRSSLSQRQIVETKGTITSYTLGLADENKVLWFSAASAIAFTIPTFAAVAFADGARIDIVQTGAGRITVSGSGITIVATPSQILRATGSTASLLKLCFQHLAGHRRHGLMPLTLGIEGSAVSALVPGLRTSTPPSATPPRLTQRPSSSPVTSASPRGPSSRHDGANRFLACQWPTSPSADQAFLWFITTAGIMQITTAPSRRDTAAHGQHPHCR